MARKKLGLRKARQRLGMTQVEMAKAANVSRSTVQRAEKTGRTRNKNLLKIYENIERNRDISKEYKTLTKMVKRRLDKLEEAGLQSTPAYRNIVSQGIPDLVELTKDPATANRKLSKLKEMMDYKTIEVKGAEEWKENVREAAIKTAGLEELEEDEYTDVDDVVDVFFKVLDTVLSNPKLYYNYFAKDKNYSYSQQVEKEINKIIFSELKGDKTFVDYETIMDRINTLSGVNSDAQKRREARRGLF